jgi:hypothetical protein
VNKEGIKIGKNWDKKTKLKNKKNYTYFFQKLFTGFKKKKS